ncbi:MAG: PrsW family intramembrane metalloprotease [Anaerolineales bacterium]|nr:PrsW family intramembrane metalloprotease [Anaerolineales bacterium]
MPFLVSLFFGFAPMFLFAWFVYWLDRFEKEPRFLLGVVFTWGVIFAAGGAFLLNTLAGIGVFMFTGSEYAAEFSTGTIVAPIVEETLKGVAVLAVLLVFRREFDSVLDGIIYAGIAALGFAATENTHYIYNLGYLEGGWEGLWSLVFVRVFVVGWQHPFYTAFTGIGLGIARMNRNWAVKISAPLAGLGTAILAHALHNTLANTNEVLCVLGSLMDWGGWSFMFLFIVWMIIHEQNLLKKHLAEEVQLGRLTSREYYTAISLLKQSAARTLALFTSRGAATRRFYQVCGELAHKKEQSLKLGDESGNSRIIRELRGELSSLTNRVET